ncbi:MAG TPA: hypothetical protein VGB35_01035 [Gammaproteobacteria bacterium]
MTIEIDGVLWRLAIFAGLLAVLLSAGCTGLWDKSPEPGEAQRDGAAGEAPAMQTPAPAVEEAESAPEGEEERAAAEPTEPTAQPDKSVTGAAGVTPAAKPAASSAEPAGRTPAAPAAAEDAATGTEVEQATAPLDLELLEKRLKETRAIGLFTKLALKNQVDDLLEKFRAYYQGRSNATPSQLRQPYELLIMKVLALLQDSDPPLARDILDSREAIWTILTDPEKFATL